MNFSVAKPHKSCIGREWKNQSLAGSRTEGHTDNRLKVVYKPLSTHHGMAF